MDQNTHSKSDSNEPTCQRRTNITDTADTCSDSNYSTAVESNHTISFDMLQHAVERSVKRMTSKKRILPYIKEHFRDVYRADSKNVLEFYKSMMTQLESMIREEFQMQLSVSKVEELLGSLDKIQSENSSSQRKWRPSGNPREDMKAHLQESSKRELQQLEKVLCTLESQNKYLNDRVIKTDEKLLESMKTLENYCLTWEEAAQAISDETRQELIDLNLSLSSTTV